MRGFSIVELMIALAVAAILVALAVPSFRGVIMNSNVTELNNELTYALNLARSEAVRRGTVVEVKSAGGGASWNSGWSVIADTGYTTNFSGALTTISQQGAVPSTYTVCASSSGGSAGAVIFTATGTQPTGTSSFDINVNRPDANKSLSRHLSVGASGAVKSQSDTTGSPAPSNC